MLLDVVYSATAANTLAAEWGRAGILRNNAGIARRETAAGAVADKQWPNVLDVNLNGSF